MAHPDISLLGAVYSNVSGVTLPKSGGGTATFPFVEGSQTITTNSTYDVTNLAQVIVNVAGGGGSGLVYETGTYTPTSDAERPTIRFANSHTTAPFYILMSDAKNDYGTSGVTNTNMAFEYVDWWQVNGAGMYYSSSTIYYGVANYWYRSSSANQITTNRTYFTHTSSEAGTANSYPVYWATKSAFNPYSSSTSRYWRSGRTYKWIAVWAPTT